MLKEQLLNVQKKSPLIHNITNYVTVNDCANVLLACGGSPIMADDIEQVEEITSICGGLNINIGTLNQNTIKSMLVAGKKANQLSHPIILDPVGAGASALRTETALSLLEKVQFTVIRGNISEIKTLALGFGMTKGVDADAADAITSDNLDDVIIMAKKFAQKTGAVIAITGTIDIVTDGKKTFIIKNGHPMMSKITGTGCMLTAMISAYVVANPSSLVEAVAASICAMGLSGEIAFSRLSEKDGTASFRMYLIDAISNLTPSVLEKGAKYEIR